ncbi:MAG: carbon-nitrogen hydrolase family protein, partial [candidate division Zixibacteria bacterium]|nr:carbon-nitrogen hydrolase family protein [candidate division Zixibacteria bacterium]
MKSNKVKIAAIQKAPVFLNKKASIELACELIVEVGKGGASLAVFPEAFIPSYPDWVWAVPSGRKPVLNQLYTRLLENSVSIPDQATDRLCRAAQKAEIYVAIGI